jgi:Tripartite tricarboxylate transporter TctB family
MSVLPPTDRETRRQRIGALALVAVGLLFMWHSAVDLPFGTVDNPGPALTPFALAVLLVVFALWTMVGGAAGALDPIEAETEEAATEPGAARHAMFVIVGILASALGLAFLGYRLTILALLLFYLGIVERKPVLTALLVSIGIAYGSHALFVHVLKVSLPSGPWGL